jgi:hypothetical protein
MGHRFTMRAEGPAYSRQIIRAALIGEKSEAVENAALLTSELVADAMEHGSEEPDLFVDVRRGYLHVEVYDAAPPLRSDGEGEEGGDRSGLLSYDVPRSRLRIVDRLSSAWGHESRVDVSALWFDLEL